jgi:SAM-dependent methyltransferase
MSVLNVGCGTGALAQVAFEQGAQRVVCRDISAYMLREAVVKESSGSLDLIACQLDAGALLFADGSFDAVLSGMTFGLLPDQELVSEEMIRVAKPGGLVCIGAHGPGHYWEAIDATLRCINKRYVLGYRFKWWPRTEVYIRSLLERAHLEDVRSHRQVWQNRFKDGHAAYDFFSAISASWWYEKFPPQEREKDSRRTRDYFQRKGITVVTDDIVIAYGFKPINGK